MKKYHFMQCVPLLFINVLLPLGVDALKCYDDDHRATGNINAECWGWCATRVTSIAGTTTLVERSCAPNCVARTQQLDTMKLETKCCNSNLCNDFTGDGGNTNSNSSEVAKMRAIVVANANIQASRKAMRRSGKKGSVSQHRSLRSIVGLTVAGSVIVANVARLHSWRL